MSDRFQELALFVRVVETGSFSRAGREAGMAQPSVSRVIGALETRLGVKLLMRTTRKVAPTESGAALLERARIVLAELGEAEDAARGADSLTGVLRVATPVTFGAREIMPGLGAFLAAHPALRVEMLMADRRVDLIEEGVDLAIRLGPQDDSSFITRRIASAPRFLVASPHYLDRRGAPAAVAELQAHDIIMGHAPGTGTWKLRHAEGGVTSIRLTARVAATSIEGMLAAALAGLGIADVSFFACRAELASGALRRVLDQHALAPIDVYAVFPAGRRPPAKARAFVEHVATAFD